MFYSQLFEQGLLPALVLDILQFFKSCNQPEGHALVGFEQLRILILSGKPCHADKLVGKDHVRDRFAFNICQMYHAVIAEDDIAIDLQPLLVILAEALGQHCCCRIAGVVNSGIPLCQVKVDEAPLILVADDIAGVGITVDDLPGQLRIQWKASVRPRACFAFGSAQSLTVAKRSASLTQSSILFSARWSCPMISPTNRASPSPKWWETICMPLIRRVT